MRMKGFHCNRCDKYYVGGTWSQQCPFCDGYGREDAADVYRCTRCDKYYVGGTWSQQCPFCGGFGNMENA